MNTTEKHSERISNFCCTSGTRLVTLVKTPVISYESGKKDGNVTRANGT
jgi:hypothetical protein